ncbi:TetR/AcrR family transcriptional regulator [Corynebacterium canis]|uniref:TetR/AcrR family transcriptional regulator n=1 Tax=Corynebacterium canis TaxID=679663 RepID=A0A5C5UAR1_9CORY|nr:TetR/AcrR family transcriptional regulator [Corynebacterium canis]TWT22933.1 TetR/AcrR family transcriptional regulator [Corynebacterium canis]WJY74709.1 hypothetical protein CCANI_04290 [Corynebacterium canis]
MTTAGRKTGPKPRFHIDDVVRTALTIGLDDFTLADVARTLQVTTPSLYRVVATRDHLIHFCLAAMADSLTLPPNTLSWKEQLRYYAEELWRFAERYPNSIKTLIQTPGAHVHVQRYFRTINKSIMAAGFPGTSEDVDFALDFLGDTVFMTHLQIAGLRNYNENGTTGYERAEQLLSAEAAESGEPTHMPVDESWRDRGYLDRKIDLILKGFDGRLGDT